MVFFEVLEVPNCEKTRKSFFCEFFLQFFCGFKKQCYFLVFGKIIKNIEPQKFSPPL